VPGAVIVRARGVPFLVSVPFVACRWCRVVLGVGAVRGGPVCGVPFVVSWLFVVFVSFVVLVAAGSVCDGWCRGVGRSCRWCGG
jgi:hypothetical protein